jgi:hypothetical protein
LYQDFVITTTDSAEFFKTALAAIPASCLVIYSTTKYPLSRHGTGLNQPLEPRMERISDAYPSRYLVPGHVIKPQKFAQTLHSCVSLFN